MSAPMIKWYTDRAAQVAHAQLRQKLEPFVTECFPAAELSHVGIHRNDESGEIIIKLHLNKIGRVSVSSDPVKLPE